MLIEIKKKKCILLESEASDWLQIWTKASSLNIKGKKAIIFFFSQALFFFSKYGHIVI